MFDNMWNIELKDNDLFFFGHRYGV